MKLSLVEKDRRMVESGFDSCCTLDIELYHDKTLETECPGELSCHERQRSRSELAD